MAIKIDLFRDLLSIQDRMNKLFDDTLFKVNKGLNEDLSGGVWAPSADIYEADELFIIRAELPGISIEDINIELQDNTLIIKGERKRSEEKMENYHRIERLYGKFFRSFELPSSIKEEGLKASFQQGVLEISLPKNQTSSSQVIKVNVE